MEIFIILILVLVNGVFSMAEMSLVSARKFKLENAKRKGSTGAKAALELSENPTRFLSTVQIGITLIGILLGVYSGENLTNDFQFFLDNIAFIKPYSHDVAVGLIVLFITYISIVLGELLPKKIALVYPESIAITLSKPMKIISLITAPFVWLLSVTNDFLLKILGIKSNLESKVSEEEIKSIIKESVDGGEIQEIEQNIVERVFELGDKRLKSLQTHRTDIIFFNLDDDFETISQKITTEKHSAYPVCTNHTIDEVIGIVLLKDLFINDKTKPFHLKDYIKEPVYVNENTFSYNLLETFKSKKIHYAIIIDEYGSTTGIVTMDDVLDALVGDVTEDNQSEYSIFQRDENSWLVDGQYPLSEFMKYFKINDEEINTNPFVTVAGLFLDKSSSIPNVGDKIKIDTYRLEIIDKDAQRIDKIIVIKID